MKKFLKILMIFTVFTIVAITALTIWKGDTIIAAFHSLQYQNYTKEELNQKIQENDQKLKEEIAEYTGGAPLRDLSEEEHAQVERGETTYEEVYEKILQEIHQQEQAQPEKPADSQPQQNDVKPVVPVSPTKAITDKYIAKMYGLKSKYIGQLDACIAQAISEYKALPGEEHTNAAKRSIISKYVGRMAGLESACDAEVNSVLSSMEKELKEIGADTSIIQTVRSAYANEKSMKIAYYMATYG